MTIVHRYPVTLVELIAVLTVIAVLGALVAPYVGSVLRSTADPITQARAAAELVQAVERMSRDYERDPALGADLALFRDQIVNRTENYGSYDTAVCSFVALGSGSEVPGTETDVLKVTLANKGAVFVVLFPYRTWP